MQIKKLFLIVCGVTVFFCSFFAETTSASTHEKEMYLLKTEEGMSPIELYNGYINDGLEYLEQENFDKAKEAFWSAANLRPQVPDAYVNLGITAIKEADYESAVRLLVQAQGLADEQYSKNEILYYNLGLAEFMQYDYRAAQEHLAQALQIYPDFGEAMYYLARCYEHQGQGEAALLAATKARNVFQRKGQVEYATKCGEIIAGLNNRYQTMTDSLARNLAADGVKSADAGNEPQGISFLKESLLLDPRNANTYLQLGEIYANNGKLYEAIEYYKEAVKLAPNFTDAHVGLGEIYVKIARYEEALASLEAALKLDKNNSRCNYDLGVLYKVLSKENTAEKYFTEAKRIADGKENNSLLKTMPQPMESPSLKIMHPTTVKVPAYRRDNEPIPSAKYSYTTFSEQKNKGVFVKGYYIAAPKTSSKGKRVNKFQKTPDY
ncbi:MAG: tetratricopeptide repeat protein [Candidatus Omnitrophica bacterium]|nr:tetratricopeptide repeat protein [Candidatus Omnitrophota bacterium]